MTIRSILFTALCLLMLTAGGCPGRLKLERPISLYKGCPQLEGICEKTKTELKAEVKAAMPDITEAELSQWMEQNLASGTKIKVLPAKASLFSKFTCSPTDDMGVVLKLLNDHKRRGAK